MLGLGLLALFLTGVGGSLVVRGVTQAVMVFGLEEVAVEQAATVLRIDATTTTVKRGEHSVRQVISLPVMQFDHGGRQYQFTAHAVSDPNHAPGRRPEEKHP